MADSMHEAQGTGETVIMDVLKTVVVRAHQATDDTQLDLRVNDIVYVLEQDETGWWGGHKEGEEATGWFPGSCVRPVFDGTMGQQQLVSAGQGEQAWQQGGQQAASSACPAEEGPKPMDVGKHPLETEQRSPVRRSLMVASPQRGNYHNPSLGGATASGPAIPGTPVEPVEEREQSAGLSQPGSDVQVEALVAENSKLKQENVELNDTIKMMKRQSDVDRRNCSEMEAQAEAEKIRREEIEKRLKAENSEKESVQNEATQLKKQLEDSKATIMHIEALYKSKLEDKDHELRQVTENCDTQKRSVQTERQRARTLQEQLQLLQEQLASARRTKERAEALEAEHIPTQAAVETQALTVNPDETRRRLFPSTASSTPLQLPLPTAGERLATLDDFAQGSPLGSPITETTRGRALTAGGRPQPAVTVPVLGAGRSINSTPAVQRPPEAPRAASSAPRAGRGAGSPNRLGHAHSTGELDGRHRAASMEPSLEDAPPRGCVADKVTMFEQRCQTPRLRAGRTEPRSEPHDTRQSRTSREDRTVRATPPALPRQAGAPPPAVLPVQTAPTISSAPMATQVNSAVHTPRGSGPIAVPTVPLERAPGIQALAANFQVRPVQEQVLSGRPGVRPRGLELTADDEEDVVVEQVDMGMSPICRPTPQEQQVQTAPSLVHDMAKPVHATQAATAQPQAPAELRAGGAKQLQQPHQQPLAQQPQLLGPTGRENNDMPEVSVLERIRQLEVR